MILIWFILIPLVGGLLAWLLGRGNDRLPRWISLIALIIDFILVLSVWVKYPDRAGLINGPWLAEVNLEWIPRLGISFHLAMDGRSSS
jgi:NADH-quinone oxidoreductase subunit M